MKDYIKIKIIIGTHLTLNCNYVTLDPYAPSNVRTFHFHQIKEKYNQSQISEALMLNNQMINIEIWIMNRFKKYYPLNLFTMFVTESILTNKNLTLSGLFYAIDQIYDFYYQGVIDIYNTWKNDKEFSNILPSFKKDYATACLYYAGGVWPLQNRDEYIIDWDIILDKEDFLIQAGYVFCGNRGYAGHCLDSFDDCLIEYINESNYFEGSTIILKYSQFNNYSMRLLFGEIHNIFLNHRKIDLQILHSA